MVLGIVSNVSNLKSKPTLKIQLFKIQNFFYSHWRFLHFNGPLKAFWFFKIIVSGYFQTKMVSGVYTGVHCSSFLIIICNWRNTVILQWGPKVWELFFPAFPWILSHLTKINFPETLVNMWIYQIFWKHYLYTIHKETNERMYQVLFFY